MNRCKGLRILTIVLCLMIFAGNGRADDAARASAENRKHAAHAMYDELASLPLRKIYVADFVDASGKRTGLGCYLAATFSKLLSDDAKTLAILSRIEAHKYLKRSGWTESDLSKPEVASKLASEFAVDGILSAVVSLNQDIYIIDFTARDLSGKELFHQQYRHVADAAVRGIILSTNDEPGPDFYFPGLDGVSQPKCIYCPSPNYSDTARNEKRAGTIVLSAQVT